MKDKKILKTITASIFLIAILGHFIYKTSYVQKTFFYPLLYSEQIKSAANKNKVEPWLVAALIKNESKFKAGAISDRGALGLMQIMPDTGQWIAKQINYPDFKEKLLLEPQINVSFGSWYISELQAQFKDTAQAIAAYNAGRGQVEDWIKTGKWDGKTIEQIPFTETKLYVKKVMCDQQIYKTLYEKTW